MICKICNKNFSNIRGLSIHLSIKHKDITHENYYNNYIKKQNEKCLICNSNVNFISITKGYRKYCNKCNRPKTKEEHIKVFGNLLKYNKEKEKRIYRNSKNGLIEKYGKKKAEKICKSFGLNKNGLIEKYGKKKAEKICKDRGQSTRIEYFLEKTNGNLELSKQMLKQRQSTFSKESCIKKYGKIEGLKVWKERQEKWQNTLNSKPQEEIDIMNRNKTPGKYNISISNAEIELQKILKCNSQIELSGYRFDLGKDNNLIEYNGDYWHCNPKFYDKEYYNELLDLTAEEKWEKDKKKIAFAKSKGYNVLVIWEDEYKTNKIDILKRCKKFLNG